jgi:hypothetical protein
VIVGTTSSSDFPLVTPLISDTSETDGFIVKLDSQLTKILFSTRLGGIEQQNAPLYQGVGSSSINAVALDPVGNIYVTGWTSAINFPTTPGAFQTNGPQSNIYNAAVYAFVSEISADGANLAFSTFFGSQARLRTA